MAFSFFTLLVFGQTQLLSLISCQSLAALLTNLTGVKCYQNLLKVTPYFCNMMTSLQAAQLENLLSNLECVSCAKSNELHLSIDGNFKLSRIHREELISLDSKLQRFMVPDKDVLDYSNGEKEASACTDNLKAINERTRGRNGPNYDETGVVGLFCARHGTPLLFINSFAGEKACYVDTLLIKFLSLSRNQDVSKVFLYYDINCNYHLHFDKYDIGKFNILNPRG